MSTSLSRFSSRILALAAAGFVMVVVPAFALSQRQTIAAESEPQSGPAEAWEVQVITTVSGVALPANTETVCLSEEDRLNPPKALTTSACPQQTFQRDGDTIRWKGTCEGSEAQGEITFKPDNTMTGKVTGTRYNNRIEMGLTGRKIGSCTKS